MSHDATMTAEALCTNCGAEGARVFCAQCGEKQPHHHDLKIGHFLHEAFHELVHLDSKLFRTMRDLVMAPGELTAAYFAGRKKRYIAPLRLFLTFFALQFLAYSAYKPVAIYSVEGLMKYDRSGQFQKALERAAKKRNVPFPQLVERIDHRWQKNMSMFSLFNIAGLALFLKMLFIRRRRYMTEHLVFGTHYMCFAYLSSIVVWPFYLAFGIGQSNLNFGLMTVMFIVTCIWLFHAFRRFYGERGVKGVVKTVLMWVGVYITTVVIFTASLVGAMVYVL